MPLKFEFMGIGQLLEPTIPPVAKSELDGLKLELGGVFSRVFSTFQESLVETTNNYDSQTGGSIIRTPGYMQIEQLKALRKVRIPKVDATLTVETSTRLPFTCVNSWPNTSSSELEFKSLSPAHIVGAGIFGGIKLQKAAITRMAAYIGQDGDKMFTADSSGFFGYMGNQDSLQPRDAIKLFNNFEKADDKHKRIARSIFEGYELGNDRSNFGEVFCDIIDLIGSDEAVEEYNLNITSQRHDGHYALTLTANFNPQLPRIAKPDNKQQPLNAMGLRITRNNIFDYDDTAVFASMTPGWGGSDHFRVGPNLFSFIGKRPNEVTNPADSIAEMLNQITISKSERRSRPVSTGFYT